MWTRSAATIAVARWAATQQDDATYAVALLPLSWLARLMLTRVPAWWRTVPAVFQWLFARLFLREIEAEEITDGNVNFSFRIKHSKSGHSVFLKAAAPYLKWQPQMALETERMAREISYFADATAAIGQALAVQYLPCIVHFDSHNTFVIQEFLGEFTVLFDQCFDVGRMHERAAAGVGNYLGHVHSRTLSSGAPTLRATQQAVRYWNPSLRAIQLEHVFTVCFEKSARGRELASDPEVMAEVSALTAKYLGLSFDGWDRYALCHGDLHPGGVMVAPDGRVKVIDPEFCQWGPPGLDVGSFLSGLVLAHLYRHQLRAGSATGPAAVAAAASVASAASPPVDAVPAGEGGVAMDEAMEAVWRAYTSVLTREGVSAEQQERIGADAVGFCMMEVCRTALGFAGVRDPSRRLGKATPALDSYQATAVRLVRDCLLRCRKGGAMRMLLDRMHDVSVDCGHSATDATLGGVPKARQPRRRVGVSPARGEH